MQTLIQRKKQDTKDKPRKRLAPYRDTYQVCFDVVRVMSFHPKAYKTWIMVACRLTPPMINKTIQLLKDNELIIEIQPGQYNVTLRGLRFIELFGRMLKAMGINYEFETIEKLLELGRHE